MVSNANRVLSQIKPIISGYLRKEAPNKMTGTAKKRYFFLKNRFLFYYKQPFVSIITAFNSVF